MRYFSLWLIALCASAPLFAQKPSPPQAAGADSKHGLVLILSRDQTPEPPDSAPLKACLVHNPPLACVLLTVTIKNEGKESILTYSSTCPGAPFTFDFRKPNGEWEPFPTYQGRTVVCESTVGWGWVIWRGRSYAEHVRLADYARLDARLSPSDGLHAGDDLNAPLAESGTTTIRVHRSIGGCVASERVAEGETFVGVPLLPSPCVDDQELEKPIDLQSNELELTETPGQR